MAFGSREKGTLATGNRALCHCQRWSVFEVNPTIDQGSMAGLCRLCCKSILELVHASESRK
jgi:hypothetical protein